MNRGAREAVRRVRSHPRLRQSVGLLPSALTVSNIALGYFAIVKTFDGDFLVASLLILVAGLVDKIDGAVARATGTTSDFGKELDSLADVISFGVAPSLLVCRWGLQPMDELGWAVAFLFASCGALRLARFNNQPAFSDRRYTVGLTIPAAASLPTTLVFAHAYVSERGTTLDDPLLSMVLLGALAALAFLMVGNLRYRSFKDVHVGRQDRWRVLLVLVLAVALLRRFPHVVLPLLSLAYVASGPAVRLAAWLGRRPATLDSGSPEEAAAEPDQEPRS